MKKILVSLFLFIFISFVLYLSVLLRFDAQIIGYFTFRPKCLATEGKKLTKDLVKDIDKSVHSMQMDINVNNDLFDEEVESSKITTSESEELIVLRKSFFPDDHLVCELYFNKEHIVTKAKYTFWTE